LGLRKESWERVIKLGANERGCDGASSGKVEGVSYGGALTRYIASAAAAVNIAVSENHCSEQCNLHASVFVVIILTVLIYVIIIIETTITNDNKNNYYYYPC